MKIVDFVILLNVQMKGVIDIYTYQMVGLADQNDRIYISKYGAYSKKKGFELSELSKSMSKCELINNLFHEDCWSLKKEIKRMTKEEIEKALGYEVEIIGDDLDKVDSLKRTKIYNFPDDDLFSFLFK